MTTSPLLELFAGFLTAGIALWFVVLSRSEPFSAATAAAVPAWLSAAGSSAWIRRALERYFLREGLLASSGLLLLRLAIGLSLWPQCTRLLTLWLLWTLCPWLAPL